jgi:hypothetical protein
VLVCLASTIHSQSFSLSQRFNPACTVWPYFMPLPSVGLQPSELFPLDKPYSLSRTVTLLPFKLARVSRKETLPVTFAPAKFRPVKNMAFTGRQELSTSEFCSGRVSVPLPLCVTTAMQPMLSWPLPSPRCSHSHVGLSPSPHVLVCHTMLRRV